MDIKNIFAKLKCPPKPADTCPANLEQCQASLKSADLQVANLSTENAALQGSVADLSGRLTSALEAVAPLQKQVDDLMATSELLKHGPPTPDMTKVRWLPQGFIDQVISSQLGAKYTGCPAKHFSEADYLVCSLAEMKRFIAYYAMFWMPNIKYVVQNWTKLNGTKVDIWMNDCDDFADFFSGINALNTNWACFPWGQIWAEVQGLFIAGGHAFNILICCDDTYNETGITGLKAYLLEPQMAGGGPWPALRPHVAGYELKELREVAGAFEIKGTIWMVKV